MWGFVYLEERDHPVNEIATFILVEDISIHKTLQQVWAMCSFRSHAPSNLFLWPSELSANMVAKNCGSVSSRFEAVCDSTVNCDSRENSLNFLCQ